MVSDNNKNMKMMNEMMDFPGMVMPPVSFPIKLVDIMSCSVTENGYNLHVEAYVGDEVSNKL